MAKRRSTGQEAGSRRAERRLLGFRELRLAQPARTRLRPLGDEFAGGLPVGGEGMALRYQRAKHRRQLAWIFQVSESRQYFQRTFFEGGAGPRVFTDKRRGA